MRQNFILKQKILLAVISFCTTLCSTKLCYGTEIYDSAHYNAFNNVRLFTYHAQDHLRQISFKETMLSNGQKSASHFNLWTSGMLGRLEIDNQKNSYGFTGDHEAFMFGLDASVKPWLTLGTSLAYYDTNLNINTLNQNGTFKGLGILAYCEYRYNDDQGPYINSVLGYFDHSGKGHRPSVPTLPHSVYEGSLKGYQWLGAAEGGYIFSTGKDITFSPYVRLTYDYLSTHPLHEKGDGLPEVTQAGEHQSYAVSAMAMKVSKTFSVNDSLSLLSDSIRFTADMGWLHTYKKNIPIPEDLGKLGLEIYIKPSEAFGISLKGDFELGKRYTYSLVAVDLSYKW